MRLSRTQTFPAIKPPHRHVEGRRDQERGGLYLHFCCVVRSPWGLRSCRPSPSPGGALGHPGLCVPVMGNLRPEAPAPEGLACASEHEPPYLKPSPGRNAASRPGAHKETMNHPSLPLFHRSARSQALAPRQGTEWRCLRQWTHRSPTMMFIQGCWEGRRAGADRGRVVRGLSKVPSLCASPVGCCPWP